MTYHFGNLWNHPADARCVTTNGIVRVDGTAVMGAGIAWEAKNRYPELPKLLARHILDHGNVVGVFNFHGVDVVTFPTKHNWKDRSDINLIKQSAERLTALTDALGWDRVALPRVGCGNGGLIWADVKAALEPILDSRFHVVTLS